MDQVSLLHDELEYNDMNSWHYRMWYAMQLLLDWLGALGQQYNDFWLVHITYAWTAPADKCFKVYNITSNEMKQKMKEVYRSVKNNI